MRCFKSWVTRCRWDDAALVFVTGRGAQRRVIALDVVAAVSPFAHEGRATIRWTPVESCYRAMHCPPERGSAWSHPYRRRAA